MSTRRRLRWLATSVAIWVGWGSVPAAPVVIPGTVADLSSEGFLSPSAYFGSAVALDNATALIAGLKPGVAAGRVGVYDFDGGTWNSDARLDLLPGVVTTGFGAAVALSGDTAAVLARTSTTLAIDIFSRNAGGIWTLQKTFTPSDWPLANVTAIAVSGDTLLMGNPTDAPPGSTLASGFVDVFVRVGTSWIHQKTLKPSDPIRGERFGTAVAMDNASVVIGAPRATVNKRASQGACYVFARKGDVWTQSAKVTDPAGAASDQFGATVAFSGSRLLAGSAAKTWFTAKGSVAGFHLDSHGIWQPEGPLPAPVADADPKVIASPLTFGARIALSGSLAVVGNTTTLATTDRSYLYQHRGSSWVQLTPFGLDPAATTTPPFPVQSSLGGTVAVSGRNFLVGSPNETSPAGVRSGVSRFYNYVSAIALFDGATLSAPELAPVNLGDEITVNVGRLVVGSTINRLFTLQNLSPTLIPDLSFDCDNPVEIVVQSPATSLLAPEAAATLTVSITPGTTGDWESRVFVYGSTDDGSPGPTLHLVGTVVDSAQPVVITTEPKSVVTRFEGPCQLSVSATGTEPLKYQWYRNGSAIKGATTRLLTLPAVVASSVGSYTVDVSNGVGNLLSDPATVGLYQVEPATALRFNEGNPITLIAPVTGSGFTFSWPLNGVALKDNATYSGTSSATLVIKSASDLTAGQFSVVLNPASLKVVSKAWNVSVLMRPVMQGSFAPLASISVITGINFHFAATPAATSYAIKDVPPGIVVDQKTGTLSGRPLRPGAYTLHVAGINAAGTGPERLIAVTVLPVAAGAVGTFQGTIGRNAGNGNLGGQFVLSTTATGQCTGYATAGARTFRFAVPVGLQPDGSPYQVEVFPTASGETLHYTFDLNPVTGRVTGQFVSSLFGVASAITGWRNTWSLSTPATLWSDYFTCGLAASPPVDRPLTIPQGTSYGTVSVTTAGIATWAGRMADGSVTTQSSLISPTQVVVGAADHVEIPLHFLINAGTGSSQGLLLISQSNPALATFHAVAGGVDWFKNSAAGRSYATGIDLHSLVATGGPYAPPVADAVVLGLPVAGSNAQLVFAGGGIETAEQWPLFGAAFTLTVKSLAFFDTLDPFANKLAVNPLTGTFSGSFTLADADLTRIVSYSGVLLSRQQQSSGFFLLPALPSAHTTLSTSAIQSGSVLLHAAH